MAATTTSLISQTRAGFSLASELLAASAAAPSSCERSDAIQFHEDPSGPTLFPMSTPTAQPQPPQGIPLPRALIFFASFWLIGSWILAMGLRTPVHPNSASFTPGVRLMMLCITVGIMIGWPLMRLSQAKARWPIRQTILDVIVLLLLVQVVIWPLRLVTDWSTMRTAAMAATLGCWLLFVGAIVAGAIVTDRPGPRMLAMLACIAVSLLGPALTLLGVVTGANWMSLIELSPLMAVHTLGQGGSIPPPDEQWTLITLLAVGGVFVWAALLAGTLWRGATHTD